VTELRCIFGVFYSGFSHCTASFPEVYDFIFGFLFFLGRFFWCNLIFFGGWGVLENLIVIEVWCYILKIDHRLDDKGVTGWIPQFL